ncbi:MAG: 4Fe-4S dicluster domain-containing protein [bacterium]
MADMAILIDTTKCTACRGCQVACKQWNDLPAEETSFFGGPGYQNPGDLSSITLTLVKFFCYGRRGADVDDYGNWQFLKYGCMHCLNPRCMKVCDTLYRAIYKDSDGFVQINQNLCQPAICNACTAGCPFGVPKMNGQSAVKCHACLNRRGYTYPTAIKDPASDWLAGPELAPACVAACPTGALVYGDRNEIIAKARARADDPAVREKYPEVNVYGDNGPYGGLRVISVLTREPGFYSLPPKNSSY